MPRSHAKEEMPAKAPVLKIKTLIPAFSGNRVSRSRLLTLMQNGVQRPLTLISAPAGFGKTTLLSEWASLTPIPIAWVSLDPGDNDPVRFMTYLLAALESAQPGAGSEAQLMVRPFQPISLQAIQAGLSNHLLALQTPLALVLDDYHVIKSPEIHQSIVHLLEHLPPQVHLIVSTRTDPPFPLSRLRARDQAVEIRARELRFSQEESAAFLNQVMGLALTMEDVASLETRIEGWAVGLQLAGLSLKGRAEPGPFIHAFTGSHHYILDYLVEEVLNQQPEDIRDFLFQTSILERLSRSLCDAVTNRPGSQKMLETLERENLFLVPLDEERRWYRYHHLFAELLQARLRDSRPEEVPVLHRRASLWYEAHGFDSEAIEHAFAIQDFGRLADLVEKSWNESLFHNEGYMLFEWMDRIPAHEFQARPRLYLYKAWALLHDRPLDEVRQCLDSAELWIEENGVADEPESSRIEVRGMLAFLRANLLILWGDASLALAEANKALALLPESDRIWRSLAYIILAYANKGVGDEDQMKRAATLASRTARTVGNPTLTLVIQYNLGALHLMRGRLHEAYEQYEKLRAVAGRYDAAGLHELGEAEVDLAWISWEWNDLEPAEQHARDGIEIGEKIGNPIIQVQGHIVYAHVLQARADLEGALDHVGRGRQMAEANHMFFYQQTAEAYEARLRLQCGDRAFAGRWARAEERKIDGKDGERDPFPPHPLEYHRLTLPRVLLSEGEAQEALRRLDALLPSAPSAIRMGRRINILALRAVVLHATGDRDAARSSLEQALLLAEPEGYVRVFLDEGPPMQVLLSQYLAQVRNAARPPGSGRSQRTLAYARRLLACFPEAPDHASDGHRAAAESSQPPSPLSGLLSQREIEVLRLIIAGCSNQQIAEQLYITISTVKSHVNHIFSKIGVENRVQAMVWLKERNLT